MGWRARQPGREGGRQSEAQARGVHSGGRKEPVSRPPSELLPSSARGHRTCPSSQELCGLLPPPSSLLMLPPSRWAALRRRDGASFQVQDSRTGRRGGRGLPGSPPSHPSLPTRAAGGTERAASLGRCSRSAAPPEARTHTLTPLTSFPRCTLLFHGLGKKGRTGRGRAGRSQRAGWSGDKEGLRG